MTITSYACRLKPDCPVNKEREGVGQEGQWMGGQLTVTATMWEWCTAVQ